MKNLKPTILLAFLLLTTAYLYAVPAIPAPVLFTQPNGETLTVMLKGDERIHWHESIDGYTLLLNQAAYLTYAVLDEDGNLQPSEFVATDVEERDIVTSSFLTTVIKNLFYSDAQKQLMLQVWEIEDEFELRGERGLEGQFKTLCAFVQFPEKSMIKTISQFDGLMNQLGYTGNGTGSVRDFFKESSYNKFDLIITLCGIYTAPQSEAYYAGSGGTGNNCRVLATWLALQVAAEPEIDFRDYDSNNDGYVDGFHFIFAGKGQEAGGGAYTIWSHKWNLSSTVTQNGKKIDVYSCSPELYNTQITTIGVICHEMTHAFGAPDFYDTNYATGGQYDGTGNWDIMAGGSWNGSPGGNCPPHHNMYTKVQFGWITPIVLNSPVTITDMPNSAENPVAYRINTGSGNEHYLLDNRQKVKFDVSVPGSGLLIYHVYSNLGTNCINCTHPQKMYPVCASSTVAIPVAGSSNYGSINGSGCPFPGSSGKTSFNGISTPRMFYWTNTVINDKPITEITQNTSDKTVSFNFMGGGPQTFTVIFNANEGTGSMNPQNFTYGISQNLTENSFTKTGFKFTGWNTMATGGGTSYTDKQNITVTEDMTLFAQWEEVGVLIPVIHINNIPETAIVGTPLTLTGTVVPENATYKAIAWNLVDAGTTGATITGNIFQASLPGTVSANATIIDGSAIGTNYTQPFNIVVLKVAQEAPPAPTLNSKTKISITLNPISGCEFSMDEGNWQTSTIFEELLPNTTYGFRARKAETEILFASPPSPVAHFTTDTLLKFNITSTVNNSTFGTITPEGKTVVEEGDNLSFLITPFENYKVSEVLVNDINQGEITDYSFENIQSNGTIQVIFIEDVGIEESEFANIQIYSNQNCIYIKNESDVELKSVEIVDMMGRTVYQSELSKVGTVIPLQVKTGIYYVIISVNDVARQIVTKVLIRK